MENTTNLTPEEVIDKIGKSWEEKSATFSTKEELESATNEMKSQIESLKGLEEKNADIEKAIARFEGRLESFNEKAKVVPVAKKSLGARMVDAFVQNVDKIQDAVAKGTTLSLNLKADTTITDDYVGDYALTDFDSQVDRIVRKRQGILDIVNRGTTTSKFVTYVTQKRSGNAGYVGEAKAKTENEPGWEEISEEVKKIASYVKVSKEMLSDLSFIRAEINNELMEKTKEVIEESLLVGAPGGINGLLTVAMGLPTFGAGSFATSIPNANITDLLRVVKAQIEGANFTPTHIIMHPEDIAKLQLTKGTDNTYTYPMYLPMTGEMQVAGMTVISSTFIGVDKYLVGDMSKVNVRFREDINMTVGLDQDDFTRNMVTILAEARLVQYVKNNQKPAFVYGDITDDIALITAP